MVTIKEVMQYRVHQLSEQIAKIKATATMTDKEGRTIAISPKHPLWPKYMEMKAQASRCLTGILILKHFGQIPTKAALRKEMRKGKEFTRHAPKGPKSVVNSFIIQSFNELAQANKDLELNPSRFAEAAAYAEARRLEVANVRGC